MEDKLIDLEDCLQEVFDKFSISNAPSQLVGNDKFLSDGTLFYTLEKEDSILRSSDIAHRGKHFGIVYGDRIIIGRDSMQFGGKKVIPDIKKELERIRGMVQRRIHSTIDIEYCPNTSFIYVKINEPIKEYATYVTKLKKIRKFFNKEEVEDLVDYLQELFDKFSIRHVYTAVQGDMNYSFYENNKPGKTGLYNTEFSIKIRNIPKNKLQDLYNELRFAQPLIEKRLLKDICIEVFDNIIIISKE